MKTENPKIAPGVETFKESFLRHWAESSKHPHLEGEEADIMLDMRGEMWRFFSSNYVNVLASMYGWQEVAENERAKKLKAMDVVAQIIQK